MITDALLAPLHALADWIAATLPDGHPLDLGGVDAVRSALAQVNGLVPVSPVLAAVAALLAPVGVFMLVRLVVFVRNVVAP
jgi:hypothetical protein